MPTNSESARRPILPRCTPPPPLTRRSPALRTTVAGLGKRWLKPVLAPLQQALPSPVRAATFALAALTSACAVPRLKGGHGSSDYSYGSSLEKKVQTSFRGAFYAPSQHGAATFTVQSCSSSSLYQPTDCPPTNPIAQSQHAAINRERTGLGGSAKVVSFLAATDISIGGSEDGGGPAVDD